MPRKNNPKKDHQGHVATIFDNNFNHKCYGCAFAGRDFVCTTSDGECLKSNSATSIKIPTRPKCSPAPNTDSKVKNFRVGYRARHKAKSTLPSRKVEGKCHG